MRGLVQATGDFAPQAWQRFLDIQLAGMRAPGPLSAARPLSSRQLSKLAPRLAVLTAGHAKMQPRTLFS